MGTFAPLLTLRGKTHKQAQTYKHTHRQKCCQGAHGISLPSARRPQPIADEGTRRHPMKNTWHKQLDEKLPRSSTRPGTNSGAGVFRSHTSTDLGAKSEE